ncbi:PREDICTED: catenin alpha-2-like [Lipotes vexillifer]|uniref:Catenin alpha-2 n=1 Tax=Lipotes vexillifer TaxID=118797 RepID=A0A340XW34_LIPVE|nr:PREDICTED: catenin alpha-2-like [Lipotes vexillifer]
MEGTLREENHFRFSGSMTSATSPIILKWDPKSLEIRTLTVERLLEPLVTQVTTLVNTSNKGPSGKKKGRSKKAHVLAASVEQATQNFLEKGEQIAKESQDLKEELVASVEDVRKQGETMRIASSEFADDPCSSVKRGTMVRAARALLSAVTRLLILADMADVMRLLSHLRIVEEALEAVKNATNEQDLANRFKEFGKEMVKLNYVAARRQQELKDPHCRDEMAAARGALKKNATMLYTASQAFLRHPDVAATRANRDYVFKQVQEAIAGISNAAQATSPTDEAKGHTGIGELAAALNEFDNKIILDPMTFSEARFRPSLEERLESIISGAALMADSSCTRDDRRERIVAECNAVRQALQDLLSEYMNNVNTSCSLLQWDLKKPRECRGGHAGGSHSGTGGGKTSSHAGGTCPLEGNNASESVRDLVPEPSILQSMRMFREASEGDPDWQVVG